MASADQNDVLRPFRPFPGEIRASWNSRGVPEQHRPLGSAAWSEVTVDGVDAAPGDLVIDSRGRWCLVWNDALAVPRERS